MDAFAPGIRSYIDEELCERMAELSRHEKPAASIFGIDALTFPLSWGTAFDTAEYIYRDSVPVKVWFCGEIKYQGLILADGGAKASASLLVNVFRASDQARLDEILFDMASPPVDRELRSMSFTYSLDYLPYFFIVDNMSADIWVGKFMAPPKAATADVCV